MSGPLVMSSSRLAQLQIIRPSVFLGVVLLFKGNPIWRHTNFGGILLLHSHNNMATDVAMQFDYLELE